MSQWDFGYGREPTEHHEPQYPQQPPYPYPEQQEPEYPYAQDHPYAYPEEPPYPEVRYPHAAQEPEYEYPETPRGPEYQYPEAPQGPQYPPAQLPHDLYAQQPPISYPQQPQGPGGAAYLPEVAAWTDTAGRPGNADWSHDAGQAADAGWSVDAGWPDADEFPGSGQPYEPQAPYPITYERDAFEGRASHPVASQPDAAPPSAPWPDAPDATVRLGLEPSANQWRPPSPPPVGEAGTADRRRAWYPGQRPDYPDGPPYLGPGQPDDPRTQPGAGWRRGGGPWPEGDDRWPQGDEAEWNDDGPGRGRWLIPVALAVAGAAVGAAIVMFALGHARAAGGTSSPATGASTSAGTAGTPGPAGAASATGGAGPAPLTLAAAKSVLSAYTTANNSANARRSTATLATVETGGSYAIDAGLYTVQAADGAAPYAAFTPVAATYYIPRAEPAGGTRWFVVQVSNAFSADPNKVTSTEYLLFTRTASGGGWQNAVEPYLLAGEGAPQVAVSGDGLATAVGATTTSLAVAPEQLAGRTATAIDGTGAGVTVADPGALADRSDQGFWRGKLPTATVTDAHAAATGAAGQTFALLTTNGGALVFYTDAAELALTPPAGSVIHLTVPGLYSPAQALSRAGLSYLDQFAAADPPAGQGTPRVVAEYSGITGKN
jgi:hypothetical protein